MVTKVTGWNEQVVIQDQDPVLSWVTERLGVAMRQGEDKNYVLYKFSLIGLECLAA